METETAAASGEQAGDQEAKPGTSGEAETDEHGDKLSNLTAPIKGPMCFPQRAALLKSMLNFLKKAIPDPAFSDSIRHCKYILTLPLWLNIGSRPLSHEFQTWDSPAYV